ncbi:MAG TPA: ABC transporter permease [Terriglobales bacterium]|nr:ABC transporter permease [Terriglobales bacterium]
MQLKDDIRYALRQFAAAPAFTITAVLTLALGIGATTAIFSLVHTVMLKSLPVAKPSELYRIGDVENCCVNGGLQDDWSLFSYDKYKTFRDNTPGFVELAAFQAGHDLIGVRRTGSNQAAESQRSEFVSGNYFSMFGIGAYAGRMLTPNDDRKGAEPVAVMNYRVWQQKYGQDPSVIGASFTFNGQPFTVIGIAPPGFFGDRLQAPPAFWIPLNDQPIVSLERNLLDLPEQDWLDIIGRIQPGVNVKNIEARMQVELQQWLLSPVSTLHPEERAVVPKQTLHLSHGGAGVQSLRDEYQAGLRLLLAISGFVLLIACANVANLMLVRAANRKQQTSIRAALGAPRSRQIGQVLTESTVLAILGGLLGIVFAFVGTRLILHLAFQKMPVAIDATPSLPVLGFTFLVALVTGILFGVAPAWITATADPAEALRGASRATTASGNWTQRSLVIAQAALSLVLLCAAGLLIESLRNMHNQHFGFETQNRYVAHIDPAMAGYKPEQLDGLYRQLHENLAAIPGVAKVSFSLYTPMEGNNWGETVYIEGQAPPPPDSDQNSSSWVRVTNDYFETIGTKVLEGRAFNDDDTPTSRRVAVVNQSFAKKFFKNESPIGHHFGDIDMKYAGNYEIVGVTEDAMYWEPTAKLRPMYFLPERQSVTYEGQRFITFENSSHYLSTIALETMGNLPGLEPQVRRALAQVNPDMALIDFSSFGEQVETNFSQQKMIVKLTSLFGFLALILASVGIYGVTAYWVERRTSEIGIRMALGADPFKVLTLVLRGAFLQIAIGMAIGIPATILGGYAMAAQLFGVKPYDPRVLLATALVLGLAALVASIVPAQRASALDPIRALRTE